MSCYGLLDKLILMILTLTISLASSSSSSTSLPRVFSHHQNPTLGFPTNLSIEYNMEVANKLAVNVTEDNNKVEKETYLTTRKTETAPVLNKSRAFPTSQPQLSGSNLSKSTFKNNSLGQLVQNSELQLFLHLYAINETKEHNHINEITKKLNTKVVDQLEDITIALKKLAMVFKKSKNHSSSPSFLTRTVRSPFGRRQQCTVSKGKLTELKNEINQALSNTKSAYHDVNCEFTNTDADNCEEMVKLIQCGVDHLKNGFLRATSNGVSLVQVTQWKNAFDGLFDRYERDIDNVRQSVSQEFQQIIDGLKVSMQTAVLDANHLRKNLQTTAKQLCISEIGHGKISNALQNFSQLYVSTAFSDLTEITNTAYNQYGKLENVKNLVNFISRLSLFSHREFAYSKLYEEMEKSNHLRSPEIILLASKVQPENNMQDLKNKLTTCVDAVLGSWAGNIITKNFQQIKDFSKKHFDNCGFDLCGKLGEIINKAYYLVYVETILSFIRELPYVENGCVALPALFEKMKSNNHLDTHELILLACKVKEFMDMPNYPNVAQNQASKLNSVKWSLPNSVRRLIFEDKDCGIKNRHHREFLYAAGDHFNYNSDRGRIFTRTSGEENLQSYWKIKTDSYGKTFSIWNTHMKRYLYASQFFQADSRRLSFTWIPGRQVAQGHWRLTPVDNGEYFTIFNTNCNEYLYAEGNMDYARDSGRRGVFTWANPKQDYIEHEKHWEINCVYV